MTRSSHWLAALAILTAVALTGCKLKKKPAADPVAKAEEPAPAPPVDDRNSAPVAGAGIQNVLQAKKRIVTTNDMGQLGIIIFDIELNSGKMPTVSEIKAALTGDGASIRKKIDEGAIILTGTKNKDGLWAYEIDADKAGGIVLTGPTPNARQVPADEAKALIGK